VAGATVDGRNWLDVLCAGDVDRTYLRLIAWLLDPAGEHGLGDALLRRLADTMRARGREGLGRLLDAPDRPDFRTSARLRIGRREVVVSALGHDLVVCYRTSARGYRGELEGYQAAGVPAAGLGLTGREFPRDVAAAHPVWSLADVLAVLEPVDPAAGGHAPLVAHFREHLRRRLASAPGGVARRPAAAGGPAAGPGAAGPGPAAGAAGPGPAAAGPPSAPAAGPPPAPGPPTPAPTPAPESPVPEPASPYGEPASPYGEPGAAGPSPYGSAGHGAAGPSPYGSAGHGTASPSPYGSAGHGTASPSPYGSAGHGAASPSPYGSAGHGGTAGAHGSAGHGGTAGAYGSAGHGGTAGAYGSAGHGTGASSGHGSSHEVDAALYDRSAFYLGLEDPPPPVAAPELVVPDHMERAYEVRLEVEQDRTPFGSTYLAAVQGDATIHGLYAEPLPVAVVRLYRPERAEELAWEGRVLAPRSRAVPCLFDEGVTDAGTPWLAQERLFPHPWRRYGKVDPATAVDTFVNGLEVLRDLHLDKQEPVILGGIHPDAVRLRLGGPLQDEADYLGRLFAGAWEPVFANLRHAKNRKALRKIDYEVPDLVGHPIYLPPESIPEVGPDGLQPARVTAKTDVYALTLCFYEFLTGDRPYTRSELYEAQGEARLQALLELKYKRVSPIDANLIHERFDAKQAQTVLEILRAGLQPDPADRASTQVLGALCKKRLAVSESYGRDVLAAYRFDAGHGLRLRQDLFEPENVYEA